MSFFDSITKVVAIDDANTVTIRSLTYGEEQAIKADCMKINATAGQEANVAIDAIGIEMRTFRKAIIAWAGPGFDGLPVTAENIDRLPGWIIDRLKEPYNELSKHSDSEKKV